MRLLMRGRTGVMSSLGQMDGRGRSNEVVHTSAERGRNEGALWQQRVGSQVWDKGQGIAPTCPQLLNDEMKIGTSTAAMANCPG
jgi:hypothetical protein